MDENDLKLIIAQQVVLFKRIEQVEMKLKGAMRSASISTYQKQLEREALKIIDQIRI